MAELRALYEASQVKTGESATARELLTQIAERDVVHISTPIAGLGDTRGRTALLVADEVGAIVFRCALGGEACSSEGRARAARDTRRAPRRRGGRTYRRQPGGRTGAARGRRRHGRRTSWYPLAANLDRTWVEFHRRYAAGAPAAESLQRAQLAALGASKRRPGPWAALTVFGSNQ